MLAQALDLLLGRQAAPRASCGPERTRPTSRASSSRRRGSRPTRSWPSSPSASRSTRRSWCSARRVVPGRAHALVPAGPLGVGRRAARGRLAAAGLLRPARAPQADARLGAARDPRRVLRRRAPRSVRAEFERASRGRARSSASWRSCARGSARASATSTSSSSRSRRSRPWRRARTRRPSSSASACGSARSSRCAHAAGGGGRGARSQDATDDDGALGAHGRRRSRARPRGGRRRRRSTRSRRGSASLTVRAAGRRGASCAPTSTRSRPTRSASRRSRSASTSSRRLKRKHGGTIAAVLEHAERCRAERDRLAGAEETTGAARARARRGAASSWRELAARLHARASKRGGRARRARGVAELARAGDGRRDVRGGRCSRAPARPAPTARRRDAVEFLIGPNPGVPAGPLREIASGGELSRVMLALMSVATAARARRPSCSTRSTPASAARRRAPSGSACGRCRTGARSSASPICRRSPRSPTRHFRVVKHAHRCATRTPPDGRPRGGRAARPRRAGRGAVPHAGGRRGRRGGPATRRKAPPGRVESRLRRCAGSPRVAGDAADQPLPASRATTRLPATTGLSPFAALVPEVQRHRAARQAHEAPRAPADAGRHRDHRPPRPRPHGGRGPRRVRRAGGRERRRPRPAAATRTRAR